MRNPIKSFRTRPSTAVSHIDLDVIEEEEDDESFSDIELFKSLECLDARPKARKPRKKVEKNRKGKPLGNVNWIPEDLSDSDRADDDENEASERMDDDNEKDEIQKMCEKINKEFDSFDDFSLPVETECEAVPMKWDERKKVMRPMTAIEIAEREEKERIREERQKERVNEEKENRLERQRKKKAEEEEEERLLMMPKEKMMQQLQQKKNVQPVQQDKPAAPPATPEQKPFRITDLRTCLRRMSEMPKRRPEATPHRRRVVRESGAAPAPATTTTTNILDGLMRPHEMRDDPLAPVLPKTPARRETGAALRRPTIAPSQAALLIEEEEEEDEEDDDEESMEERSAARTAPSGRGSGVQTAPRRSARSQPGARAASPVVVDARRRVTRSMTKDDEALVEKAKTPSSMLLSESENEEEEEQLVDDNHLHEKEEIPVLLFSDSEDGEEQEELVGIEEAHSARVEAISARRSMMMEETKGRRTTGAATAAQPMLHSTPNKSSQDARRASARLSRLAGMSPIRRRESAGAAPFDDVIDDEEEGGGGEATMGGRRKTEGASSLLASRHDVRPEEKEEEEESEAEKMSVESGGGHNKGDKDDEEDLLVAAMEQSMTLDDERPPSPTVLRRVVAGGDETAMVTMQATVGMDTVAGYGDGTVGGEGAGTMMFENAENTMAGYSDGTVATLAEEYGDTLMMGDDASSCRPPAARPSMLQQQQQLQLPHRRTTMGSNVTLDVSMASVASVATQRNASMMSRRNVTQITNDSSRFADELPFYLTDFVGETALQQLLHVVGQDEVREWKKQLPKDTFKGLRKLGEGTYGEVFATTMNGAPVAMKIIPFEDEVKYFDGVVNGETLKSTAEILPEILITRELSSLDKDAAQFSTSCFIPLVQCHVVRGKYPPELLKEWDAYDKRKGSENDRPSEYASAQALFVVIGLAMGGVDVETYKVRNEREALSALFQLALALIVAEEELEFEHRDLHIGNVLIAQVPEDEEIKFRLMGNDFFVKSCGVKLSIIDFTNSRLRKEGTTIFLDLEQDEELFQGEGDYQFDIYRLMRQHNNGDWRSFNPKSNIFWLHYMAKELLLEERKKGLAKGFTKKRRRDLFSFFDELTNHSEIKAFLYTEEMQDMMQEYVRYEVTD